MSVICVILCKIFTIFQNYSGGGGGGGGGGSDPQVSATG
jgi:hypothetical protein